MITVEQKPITLTPVNVEHIYTFISTNNGYTDFRYVCDVYVDTTTANPTKVARLLVSPNTYGKGIINLETVVRNYVQGNAMSDEPQYTSSATTGNTAYALISNVKGVANSNAYVDNINYPERYHVRDYRVMLGEQWTSGNTTVTYISTATTTPGSTFYAEVDITFLNPFGDVNWYGAGGNIVEGSLLQQGVNIDWYRLGGPVDNYDSYFVDGSVRFTGGTPTVGDIVDVKELYSGIIYQFAYFGAYGPYETEHWEFVQVIYPVDEYSPVLSPPAITIWPGTSKKAGSYNPYVYNAPYWDTTTPDEQQNFWEVKKYRMSGTTVSEIEPSMFLTSAGSELYTINDNNVGLITTRARRRKHHPSCPILISWFNGILSQNSDFDFVNPIGCLTSVESTTQNSFYPLSGLTEYDLSGNTFTGMTPQDDRIMYFNAIRPDLAGGKIGFWASLEVGEFQYDGYAYSEFLEYYIEQDNCLSDPVHVLFLNRQGVWDTYTFDKRALETSSVQRKTYAQGGISNRNKYSQLSTERRDVIYDQPLKQQMTVSTWYLTDNDREIVEELFTSPEVYIIKDHDWTGKAEKTYNPYLLPVTLLTNTIEEIKTRYNKIYQYRFGFEYTPINEYKTQG